MNTINSRPAITLKNVSVTYRSGTPLLRSRNNHTALKDINFVLNQGDSLGVLGKNGAGKSTLLQILNGVIQPNSGTIDKHGHNTTLLSLSVGYDQNLTGRQNAVISGMLMGLEKKDIVASLDSINEFSELGHFFDQPVKNYSTGMKQRLGFAVAMKLKNDILLIDEILAVGDKNFRKKSEAVMREKITSGDTVVLVSHSPETIKKLCNKAIWIEDGYVKAEGPADEVVKEYESCD